MFAETQFADALIDPSRAIPEALAAVGETRLARRFAVYRNNVAVALIEALETRFPASQRVVGPDFFAHLARSYIAANLPRSPLMGRYGDDFPEHMTDFPGLEELAYLADVARIEAARTRAYHAADAEPLGAEAFAALDADALERVTVELHPSAEVVRSTHPVVAIWTMNAGDAEPRPIERWEAEDALVCRPAMEVLVRRLPPGGADFFDALKRGATLGDAADAAASATDDFDLTQTLVALIELGLAVRVGDAGNQGDEQ